MLDVGCGKAFLLYELTRVVPGLEVAGIDISAYALEHCKEEVRGHVQEGCATSLPFGDGSFDLVYSLMTLHNLYCFDLLAALREIKQRHPLVEVIMLTGHASIETAVQGMELGAFDYLMKPMDIDELLYKVEDAYKRKSIQEKKLKNLQREQ